MKSNYNKAKRYFGFMALLLCTLVFTKVQAQTITINPATTDAAVPQYVNGALNLDYTAAGFSTDPATRYYWFYTNGNPNNINDWRDNIIASSANVAAVLNSNWLSSGTYDLYVAGAQGSLDNSFIDLNDVGYSLAGTNQTNVNAGLSFSRAGIRSFTSNPYNLAGQKTRVWIYLETYGLDADKAVVVEVSQNGTTWTALADTNTDTEFSGSVSDYFAFDLTPAQATATTQIRVRQLNAGSLAPGEQSWYLEDVEFELGDPFNIEASQFIGQYNVSNFIVAATNVFTNADLDITGGIVYPGNIIKVRANTAGIDVAAYNFTAIIQDDNGNVYPLAGASTAKAAPLVTITGTVPLNIPYDFSNSYSNQVYIVAHQGALRLGTYLTENSGNLEFTTVGANGLSGGYLFNRVGERSFTTAPVIINSAVEAYFRFYLERYNNFRSPAGTEIVVEYTTNGSTFTSLGEFNLNELENFAETVEIAIPVGAISTTTQFRVRQKTNNGLDLDVWFADNFEISVDSNIGEDIIDYSNTFIDVHVPIITLNTITIPENLSYPGRNLTATFNVTQGTFPSGTQAVVYLERGGGDNNIVLGTTTINNVAANNVSFSVPSISAGDYNVRVESLNGVESNAVTLPVYGINLQITSVTTADGVNEGTDDIVYPGSQVTVNYSLNGATLAGTQLDVEVYDYSLNEYINVGSTTTLNGSINVTLPVGIDYNFGANGDPRGTLAIRLSLGNGILAGSSQEIILNTQWNDILDEEIIDARAGNFFSNSAYFGLAGTRSATTFGADIRFGGRAYLYLNGSNKMVNQKVQVQASINGTTWSNLEEFDFENGNLSRWVTLPNVLWSSDTRLRIIYNENGAAGFNENVLQFQGLRVDRYEFLTAAEAFWSTNDILQLSVSQATIANPNFTIGQQTTIQFNTDGPFPANTGFAVVLENSNDYDTYQLLGSTNNQGAVSVEVTMPSFALDENGDDLFDQLRIVPFVRENASDTYLRNQRIDLDEAIDFVLVEGNNNPSFFGNFYFDKAGNRSVLSRALNLSATDEVHVNFTINLYGMNSTSNVFTLPRLQVSIDGGASFQNLVINDNSPLADGIIYNSGSYSISLPTQYITSATHIRLYQPLNLGVNLDPWFVTNLNVTLGTSNELSDVLYDNFQNPQSISLSEPDLDDYEWTQLDDTTDPVFNGETFSYTWQRYFPEYSAFPTGTRFEFHLDYTDPETNEPILLGEVSAEGTFQATVPAYVKAGNYQIIVYASVETEFGRYYFNGGNPYYTSSMRVYNRVLKATLVKGNELIYAGNTVEVAMELENDITANNAFYNSIYFNLVLRYAGQDWLLATKQGMAGNFVAALPPFVSGNVYFEVRATFDGPLGEVGKVIPNTGNFDLLPTSCTNVSFGVISYSISDEYFINLNEFTNTYVNDNGTNFNCSDTFDDRTIVQFNNVSGRRQLTTVDLEIATATRLEFRMDFDLSQEELTNDQRIVLEYSTNFGESYTTLASYPDARFEDTNSINERLTLPEAARTASTRFRWRQEESRGNLSLESIYVAFGEEFPFEIVRTPWENINTQALEIVSVDSYTKCSDEEIVLSYNIKGKFGANNKILVSSRENSTGNYNYNLTSGYELAISEGSGTITVKLPSNYQANYGSQNRDLQFALYGEDKTFQNIGYTTYVNGAFNELPVEFIAPVITNQTYYVEQSSQFACAAADRFVTISNPQPYFSYQVVDFITNQTLTDAVVYNPEAMVTPLRLPMGVVSANRKVRVQVQALSKDGSVECNTVLLNGFDEFIVLPDLMLRNTSTGLAATDILICDNSGVTLQVGYYNANGNWVTPGAVVEWFKDGVKVDQGTSKSNFQGTGSYTINASIDGCSFNFGPIQVDVINPPSKPMVSYTGNLVQCDDQVAVLQGPTGFTNYYWYVNGGLFGTNSRTIETSTSGTYRLAVSNATTGCTSPQSDPITLSFIAQPILYSISAYGEENGSVTAITDGQTLNACGEYADLYLNTANVSRVTWFRNGTEINTGVVNTNQIRVTQAGTYTAQLFNGNLSTDCSITTFGLNVEFEALPTMPTIQAQLNGAAATATSFDFCAGEADLVLRSAQEWPRYNWYRNGSLLSNAADSRSITVSQSGSYTVAGLTNNGCEGDWSLPISVTVRALPNNRTLIAQNNGVICGTGTALFTVNNPSANEIYQLYQVTSLQPLTLVPSGSPVIGNPSGLTFIESDALSVDAQFRLGVRFTDANSCEEVYTNTYNVSVQNVEIAVLGNRLTARLVNNSASIQSYQWFRNGTPLQNGGTNSSITIFDNANYSVDVVTYDNCELTTSTSEGDGRVLGINDGLTKMNIGLYPNPTNDRFTMKLTDEYQGSVTLRIINLAGQTMKQEITTKNGVELQHTMSISELPVGLYMLQVITDGQSDMVRIMKN